MSDRDDVDPGSDSTPNSPSDSAPTDAVGAATSRDGRRWGALALTVVPIVIGVVGLSLFLTQNSAPTDEPAPPTVDLEAVSTVDLESLLDTYRDDPQFVDEVPSLTLLLAERHFGAGAYDNAFELYAQMIPNPRTRPDQLAVSLSRVAWIGWLSNGDSDAALATLDRSLGLDPDNAETVYITGQILWCGKGDTASAIALFDRVLTAPDLTTAVRRQVGADRDAAVAGEACTRPTIGN